MTKHHPENERVKRDYLRLLKEGKGYDEASVDAAAQAIARFESYNRFKPFDRFHFEQAIGFKRALVEQKNARTGQPLAKATLVSTMRHLREFFSWLATQPRYRSRLSFGDAAYFSLSDKDVRVGRTSVERPVPTLEQVKAAIGAMPMQTPEQRRDRAVLALAILTGARDNALASLQLRHLDLAERQLIQDARQVRTKAAKTIYTWFFPIGDEIELIVRDWVTFLREDLLWGGADPLFPASDVGLDAEGRFRSAGFKRSSWSNADPVRKIFRAGFAAAGLPYFNPHSVRKTLARLGQQVCRTPEAFKAWSQNLGHEQVLTTFSSYGRLEPHRQAEIIRGLSAEPAAEADEISNALARAGYKVTRI